MPPRRRSEQSDWTRRFRQGDFDADDAKSRQVFSKRSKFAQENKTRRTADLRADNKQLTDGLDALPQGEVIQVFSVYAEVLCEGVTYLCTVRKTLQRVSRTAVIVGDMVRILKANVTNDAGVLEAVIEQVLPRQTQLLRQDSFRKDLQDPIVANAQQMLIVASLLRPRVKWGLVDRMIIASQSGGLLPIICLNKVDLAGEDEEASAEAQEVLSHYRTLGVGCLCCSIITLDGLDELRALLAGKRTVLAGHSGVGKSSLIRSIAPELDIRIGVISTFNEKGMHTTTSARRYVLPFDGFVIDTPGVKQFGLVGVTRERLAEFFPDMEADTAPKWRRQSYQKILESL